MIEKILLAVLLSLFLLCAGIGVVVVVYLWLLWYVSHHQGPPPHPLKPLKQQGLSEAELQRLPTVECCREGAAAVAGSECAVCLELLESGERCRLIPTCRHIFHVQCVDTWLSKRSVCPICRRSAVINNIELEEEEEEAALQPDSGAPPLTIAQG